ncbi:kynurenine/alpha-aminoadipate aminotransferase, mitochondrial-like [Pecten maximus]|uniref:kynurenine/alpha-aminoadipate aminotransferase, mitochondrial-like n=1 Tax=Pecten maximus TaxID=6579 RepID=UPI00145875D3|nr:kynurenine/alpha-aminoadipate aminotransferase, mitochondrial-like [Pecten maximus]
MNYERFQNQASIVRKSSPLRDLPGKLSARPNAISMAGGLPDPEACPFIEATVKLRDGSELQIDPGDMALCMQYSHTEGFPDLRQWFKELQRRVHNPPALGDSNHPGQTDVILMNGSQDALCKSLEAMTSPGDNILIENPAYPSPGIILKPRGCNMIPVDSDAGGMDPDNLRHVLSRWSPEDAKDPSSDIPKLLYCVPTGGNPTGSGLTLERKQEIYRLAQEYDLMILEDDPYYYIQFTEPLVPSFLSLDVDGRVMRFDSMSKLISPGARLGLLTGPQPMIQKIVKIIMCSSIHVSGISQMFVLSLLKKWGHDEFLARAKETSNLYLKRSQLCVKYLKKHLTGLAEWTRPTGGMFIWIKIPAVTNTNELILRTYLKDALFVAGSAFLNDSSAPSQYIRASFSLATSEQMDQALSALAESLKEILSKKT